MLLAELSTFSQFSIDSKFLWTSWSVAMDTPQLIKENEFVAVCLLRVMGNSARKLGRVAIGDVKGRHVHLTYCIHNTSILCMYMYNCVFDTCISHVLHVYWSFYRSDFEVAVIFPTTH